MGPTFRFAPRLGGPGRTRGEILRIRVRTEEKEQLAEVARDMGLSLSTYTWRVLMAQPIPPRRMMRPIPEVNRETYVELAASAPTSNRSPIR